MILDEETDAILRVAAKIAPLAILPQTTLATIGQSQIDLRSEIEKFVCGRLEFIQAGIDRCPEWFKKTLHRFDPNLRVRFDFYRDGWVVEHLSKLDNLYHECGLWKKSLGSELIEHLRQNDTWRTSAEDLVKAKREQAERTQKSNDAAVSDQLYGTIDNMSRRQVQEFVDASEALANGEEIIPMGEDAQFMQRLYDKNLELLKQGIEVPDDPRQAMNPGMKPGVYKRQRKD